MPSKKSLNQDVEKKFIEFFNAPRTFRQGLWGIYYDFHHYRLTVLSWFGLYKQK